MACPKIKILQSKQNYVTKSTTKDMSYFLFILQVLPTRCEQQYTENWENVNTIDFTILISSNLPDLLQGIS